MKSLRNRVQLIGNLGKDPVIKEFDNNKKASFSLATNDAYVSREGAKEVSTQWHNVVAWGKVAGVIEQYVHKGTEVMIEGRLTHRSYETSEGEKRYISEVFVNEVILMNKPQ